MHWVLTVHWIQNNLKAEDYFEIILGMKLNVNSSVIIRLSFRQIEIGDAFAYYLHSFILYWLFTFIL